MFEGHTDPRRLLHQIPESEELRAKGGHPKLDGAREPSRKNRVKKKQSHKYSFLRHGRSQSFHLSVRHHVLEPMCFLTVWLKLKASG